MSILSSTQFTFLVCIKRQVSWTPLGAILCLVSGEVASPAMEKKDGGEERSVAPLWVALLSMQSSELSRKWLLQVFTHSDKAHVKEALSRLGLQGCFDGVICFEILIIAMV